MPTEPLPDYFELLRQMTGMGAAAGTGFDAAGIDKKIGELRIVSGWLQMQANAVELSVKALEYQRDTIQAMAGQQHEFGSVSAEELARYAAAFDPVQWLKNSVPPTPGGKRATPTKRPPRKAAPATRRKAAKPR